MMLKNINPAQTRSWKKLQEHFNEIKDKDLITLFKKDPGRFEHFSAEFEGIFLDYSKNHITKKTIRLLNGLAEECHLNNAVNSMFSGEKINVTEDRAVLHTALRNPDGDELIIDECNIRNDIGAVLGQMERFADKLHSGDWKGFTGKTINTIVNIGIGGSDLGPRMVTEALSPYHKKGIKTYFVSNVDGSDIAEVLKKADPGRTLFIIASKSFTTLETLTNAHTARSWFLDHAGEEEHIRKHFVAISTNKEKVVRFGIDPENMFRFWDWVGGRYSAWSAIGLSVACCVGFKNFRSMLDGAKAMDEHFRSADSDKNLPVILALIGIWYNNFFGTETEALLPYDNYLDKFPLYMQQMNMESNGKSVDRRGKKVNYQTGPVIWGAPGTNSQHSFFQLIHQGTKLIPCDFLAPVEPQQDLEEHHILLLSNFFAQTEALMKGKTKEEAEKEMKDKGMNEKDIETILPYRTFEGNKPSNSILYKKLTPYTLGSLIAMYEHKVFVQGVIWNIYSFDQWGVELGKQLAKTTEKDLRRDQPVDSHDASTNGLMNKFKEMRLKSPESV